ncbi:MAG: ABC transporter ATP-binding protein [Candidatus Methylacidiphilales bacterium]|nr:ABC transporter ATP-binding protein [Candidatus Methylacidiphilales bacterium]
MSDSEMPLANAYDSVIQFPELKGLGGGEKSATDGESSVLHCRGLHHYLGEGESRVHVLKDVSMTLYPGKIYSVMGPSGCGKSTLLYLLGLLDRPSEGNVWIGERETSALNDEEMSNLRNLHIGFVFQFHFLLREFSALENIMIPMRRAGLLDEPEMRKRAAHLLDLVGLGDKTHRHPHQLSGGEQQRVAIARSLANNPRVVLADEPTGNLDTANSKKVFSMMRKLAHETRLSMLIVTHNAQIAESSDHTYEMRDGVMH